MVLFVFAGKACNFSSEKIGAQLCSDNRENNTSREHPARLEAVGERSELRFRLTRLPHKLRAGKWKLGMSGNRDRSYKPRALKLGKPALRVSLRVCASFPPCSRDLRDRQQTHFARERRKDRSVAFRQCNGLLHLHGQF